MLIIYKFLLGIVFGIIFTVIYELIYNLIKRRRKGKELLLTIKGYHIHHSSLGLIPIILDIFFKTYYLIGFGVGIIIWHTISEKKFVFIDKIN